MIDYPKSWSEIMAGPPEKYLGLKQLFESWEQSQELREKMANLVKKFPSGDAVKQPFEELFGQPADKITSGLANMAKNPALSDSDKVKQLTDLFKPWQDLDEKRTAYLDKNSAFFGSDVVRQWQDLWKKH